jgi:hypothetical protein
VTLVTNKEANSDEAFNKLYGGDVEEEEANNREIERLKHKK